MGPKSLGWRVANVGLETRCSDSKKNRAFPTSQYRLCMWWRTCFVRILDTPPQDGASLPHVSSLLIVYTRLPISLLNLAFPAISPNSMNGNSVFPPAYAPNKNSSLSFPPASNPSANPAASSFKTNPESDHFLAPPSTSSRSHKTTFTLHCLLWSFGSCPCSLQSILGAAARGILSNQKSDHVLFC